LICRGTTAVIPIAPYPMNKQELVEAAVQRASATITKKDADIVITATLEAIMGAVAEGEKVTLVGFGTFERRDRTERTGRNPKTGAEMVIPATQVPAFSAGKQFKQKVAPPEPEPEPEPEPARELATAGDGKGKGKKK